MTPLETWLSGISAGFITAIVWLARYIRDMHNKQVEREEKHKDVMIALVEKTVKVVAENTASNDLMKAAIESNTQATIKSAEQRQRSDDRADRRRDPNKT